HIVVDGVERAAERMVGEIDAIAECRAHARKERRYVALQPRFGQRAAPQRGLDRRSVTRIRPVHGDAPMTVRTSISSGKNVWSSAFLRKLTPDEPPVP